MNVIYRMKDNSIVIKRNHWSDRKWDSIDEVRYWREPKVQEVTYSTENTYDYSAEMNVNTFIFTRKYINEYEEKIVILDEI